MTSNEYNDDIKFKKKCSFKNIKKNMRSGFQCLVCCYLLFFVLFNPSYWRIDRQVFFTSLQYYVPSHLSRDEFHKLISFILFNTISLDLYTFLPS